MKNNKCGFIKSAAIFFFLFLYFNSFAQGPSSPGSDPDLNPSVPVDGGITLLIAAGVGLGVKSIKKKHKIEK